jgi:hypothetical protein
MRGPTGVVAGETNEINGLDNAMARMTRLTYLSER